MLGERKLTFKDADFWGGESILTPHPFNMPGMEMVQIKTEEYLMPIRAKKGQRVELTKDNPQLTHVIAGLGWDINQSCYPGFDLDISVFLLGKDGKCASFKDFIFYNNLQHYSGSVEHLGDNLTGEGDGDDEQIRIDLNKIPFYVRKIVFGATIHRGKYQDQHFGLVSNAFVRVFNECTGEELVRYDLSKNYQHQTALVLAELYKHGVHWKFAAIGQSSKNGLSDLVKLFGLEGRNSN